ncbi:MAG: RsmB/NOP family class I SAM-dependent RNA methyltransferase [Roseovarius sp.]
MTPGARVQAAIDLLDDILAGAAAEKALTNWARGSRFAGSKDRRAVRDHVYQALRCKRSFAALGGAMTGRGLMLGAARQQGWEVDQIFSGQGHAPAPLDPEENAAILPDDTNATWDLPDWMIPLFQDALGDAALPTAHLLTHRAPVMARVNLRKSNVAAMISELAAEAITALDDPIAPAALRVTQGGPKLQNTRAYLEGRIELQDGSSQAAMQGIDIPDGSKVLDYCAGGGGKSLALAARAQATWFAHDALPHRMKDIATRAARADVQINTLSTDELHGQAPFDVVLCDVPCSGSGTWRRTPQAKWTLTEAELTRLSTLQAEILTDGAALVARTGQLIYATCSLFDCENSLQINEFLARNPEWTCTRQMRWPVSENGDGFFVAHLERAGV